MRLAAKIPNGISDEEAAFTVIGSIGLQGIRLCNPTFGETVVVIGLGTSIRRRKTRKYADLYKLASNVTSW